MAKAQLATTRLGLLGAFDAESIREFRHAIEASTTQRLQALHRGYKQQVKKSKGLANNPILRSYLEDEVALAESIQDLADQLAIVALYGEVEIRVKHMCSIAMPMVDAAPLFRWKNLEKALHGVGIRLENLKQYKSVNQLRCLNNSIKHSRKVDAELAATEWDQALGDEIDAKRCSSEFEEFVSSCESFLSDLMGRLAKLL